VTTKKKASDSLARLRSGIARETPATRAREEARDEVVVPADASGDTAARTAPAARAAATPAAPPTEPEKPPKKRGRPARSKPERLVRVSVDVPRSRHKFLRDFAYEAETDGMSVMRALLFEMADDPTLQRRVRERLANT
jgi:hypothetical protein